MIIKRETVNGYYIKLDSFQNINHIRLYLYVVCALLAQSVRASDC